MTFPAHENRAAHSCKDPSSRPTHHGAKLPGCISALLVTISVVCGAQTPRLRGARRERLQRGPDFDRPADESSAKRADGRQGNSFLRKPDRWPACSGSVLHEFRPLRRLPAGPQRHRLSRLRQTQPTLPSCTQAGRKDRPRNLSLWLLQPVAFSRALCSQILHVNIRSQSHVIRQVVARVIWILINHDVI